MLIFFRGFTKIFYLLSLVIIFPSSSSAIFIPSAPLVTMLPPVRSFHIDIFRVYAWFNGDELKLCQYFVLPTCSWLELSFYCQFATNADIINTNEFRTNRPPFNKKSDIANRSLFMQKIIFFGAYHKNSLFITSIILNFWNTP